MRNLMRGMLCSLAAAAMAVFGASAASAAMAQETGTVYAVHGIPDTPVDVYIDGERAIDDFAPETTQGPLALAAGPHTVRLFPADAPNDNGTPLVEANADVPAGGDISLVAHLGTDGSPTITPFVNDVSTVPAGQARLVVRHTAAAPAVDVRANGNTIISGLTNPNQEALVVDAGTVRTDVVLSGTDNVVIGPASLDLRAGTATFVHAVGSAQDGTLALVPLTITKLGGAPSGVPAGSAAPSGNDVAWVVGGSLATFALVGGGLVLWRRVVPARRP
jgi:hypothetical protein